MKRVPCCRLNFIAMALAASVVCQSAFVHADKPPSFAQVIDTVQPKIVKIHGAGGVRGLEAYQSGFLISAEGHVLTVWSYVLDTDYVSITLNDGRKFESKLVGYDPRLEIAVLKIEAEDLPHFNIDKVVEIDSGDRVLAFSNLYNVAAGDEAASVLHGRVSVKTKLAARRGAFETTYKGPVYILDAMTNNPGASGGALTDRQGQLAGLLGKELRNSQNNIWLNYSIPVSELSQAIEDIQAGRLRPRSTDDEERKRPPEAHTLVGLGITLVPDVLARTPPFVERVKPGSAAAKAGLRPDDLILYVNKTVAGACKIVVNELAYIDRIDPVRLTVQRGLEILDVELEIE